MNSPKVSIIIPIFNPGDYFVKCLESVVNQTLNEIEIICIDDGSTDDSMTILKKYSKNDSRFKIFHQNNLGAGTARNKGIDYASGEYIVFLDSDDWIENDLCEKLFFQAKKLDVDLVLFDTIWYLRNERKESVKFFEDNEFNEDFSSFIFDKMFMYDKITNEKLGVIWSKFYKTSFIKKNNIKFSTYKIFNDVFFHFKTILLAKKISYYPKVFYHYIKVGQPSLQSSHRWGKYESVWVCVMEEINDFLIENNLVDVFRKIFIDYFFINSERKYNGTDIKYQEQFYINLKFFFYSLNLNVNEFKNLILDYQTFYIHLLCSDNYLEFNRMNSNFDGKNIR